MHLCIHREFTFQDFFAQSQSKHSDFVCVADNNCVLDIQNRNKCDSCRFNKCISEGMSIKEDSSAIINGFFKLANLFIFFLNLYETS